MRLRCFLQGFYAALGSLALPVSHHVKTEYSFPLDGAAMRRHLGNGEQTSTDKQVGQRHDHDFLASTTVKKPFSILYKLPGHRYYGIAAQPMTSYS